MPEISTATRPPLLARRPRRRPAGWLASLALALPIPELRDQVVLTGLEAPTAVRFAPNGEIFVAEKAGRVLRFDSLADPTPELVADLREAVYDYWDRGLLGLAIDPGYPERRRLFVLYTVDAPPGRSPPFWNDACPTPPGGTLDGCVAGGRLSRLELPAGSGQPQGLARETVLLGDAFCQQFPSHSVGGLAFGPDGALYLSAGDGASFNTADYGQLGGSLPDSPTVRNACGDPPGGAGGAMTPPAAQGGALRSQDPRGSGDPTGWNGSILRLDPESGAALPDNPLFGGADPGDDPIVAFGLRNPFRFVVDPKSGDLFVGDVGWNAWEEIDRLPAPFAAARNFGWPCYEGAFRQDQYDALDLELCESLYSSGGAAEPYFAYRHGAPPDPERCGGGGTNAAIAGLAIYPGGDYPARFAGALFFADYQLQCIYALEPEGPGEGGRDPTETVVSATGPISDLVSGPQGDLFYLDIAAGALHRLSPASRIFADGFESGGTAGWSATLP